MKVNVYIALCDFVDFESQQKALDAKETTINGVTIQLEVRESKSINGNVSPPSNNNKNNNNGNGNSNESKNDNGYIKVGANKGTNAKDKKVKDKRVGGGNDKKQSKKPPVKAN